MATQAVISTRVGTLVDLACAVRTTVVDERVLAEALARGVARHLGAAAAVWIQPVDGLQPVRLATAHPDPSVEPALPGATPEAVLEVLASGLAQFTGATVLPLATVSGCVLGAVQAWRDREYTPEEREYLIALADTAAATLDSARLLTDSAMAAEGLRRQSEWLDQVSDAIVTCDADNQVLTWNAGAELTYQYSLAEATGCDVDALLATEYRESTGELVEPEVVFAALAGTGRWSGELRQRRADGEEVELHCSLTALLDEDRRSVGWVAVNRDVTDERRKERMALYDPLTGLPNRRYLLDYLARARERSAERGERMAVLFVDLDGFKNVNDTLGHEAGDEVLRVTARRLQSVVRGDDVVVRLGGDEFVVVATGLGDADRVRALAHRVIAAVSEPVPVSGAPATVLASVGIALAAKAGTEPSDLIRAADAAMYAAKRSRSGLVFADEL